MSIADEPCFCLTLLALLAEVIRWREEVVKWAETCLWNCLWFKIIPVVSSEIFSGVPFLITYWISYRIILDIFFADPSSCYFGIARDVVFQIPSKILQSIFQSSLENLLPLLKKLSLGLSQKVLLMPLLKFLRKVHQLWGLNRIFFWKTSSTRNLSINLLWGISIRISLGITSGMNTFRKLHVFFSNSYRTTFRFFKWFSSWIPLGNLKRFRLASCCTLMGSFRLDTQNSCRTLRFLDEILQKFWINQDAKI